ncbi:MAG: ABC transporter ATP-binding protein [Minisyncoccia bacterium]
MIDFEHISKIYQVGSIENKALNDVSFKIEDGEFIAIIGPSGSGKSTLMHILGCLDTPTSGRYVLDGKEVSQLSDNELAAIRRNKIGFVFQTFNLLPRTKVLHNVVLPLIYQRIPDNERIKRAEQALRDAALPEEFWDYYSNQISGGMMQRVAIARALITNPKIILADEPTGNLDSKTGEEILQTFSHLNQEGHTIVLITHDKYIASKAQRIISLKDGQIIEDKPIEESDIFRNIKE